MESNKDESDYRLERWMAILLALLFLLPVVANAQEAEPLPTATLGEVENAALLLKTAKPGVYAVAPTVNTEVEVNVVGPIVRTRVRQTFLNPTSECVEALYVFPLPEMSAVDTLLMTIGARVIVGEVQEREIAARQYEQARSEGRRAALVEQHRPNVFTTAVSSLQPGETAVIEITYQETAHFENGEYRLRFPMVVGHRYTPASGNPPPDSLSSRTDAGAVSISVALEPGYSLRDIRSANHAISTNTLSHGRYAVTLASGAMPTDRDFELIWKPDLGAKPEATVLTERIGDATYALVLVTPPAHSPVNLPRETVFIIDSSGSMEGDSMTQARDALLLALDDLRPGDTFNVIDFDSDARALFPESRPADSDLIDQARTFVRSLTADGGTNMLSALQLALGEYRPGPGSVRQVVFITDGHVGNEQELFSFIHDKVGESRLFTVGIGSAPNSHFMRNAARTGRGTFTYIGEVAHVKERMGELFRKLGSPVMTSIELEVDDPTAESWPSRVPDLYAGEPLVAAVRLIDVSSPIVVRGRIGAESWSASLNLPAPQQDAGIGRLWARQKIESVMDRLSEGGDAAAIRREVVEVALRHQLVSPYTSLVAVDRTPAGLSCKPSLLAMPHEESSEGSLPQTATPGALLLLIGAALMSLAVVIRGA